MSSVFDILLPNEESQRIIAGISQFEGKKYIWWQRFISVAQYTDNSSDVVGQLL